MSRSQLIVIVGPTGAGKTDLSVRIASHYGAPILSTDSRQIYRELPIGTAQPSFEQLHAVEHHFIASHNITQEFNCGAFESAALQLLETLFRRGRRVVAVGGSGLYVRALCEGMDDLPQADGVLRFGAAQALLQHGQELRRDGAVDEQDLGRVADGRAARFCVFHDIERHIEIGALVNIDMADARAGLDARHDRVLDARADEARPAARDEQVNIARGCHESGGPCV